jgi:hypothetical protein
MRPQTDLLILLTGVIIINDSQTNLPDPAGVSRKLIWKVKLSEVQEGTLLINRTICALSGPCLVSFKYCPGLEASRWAQMGPSTLTCTGPSKDHKSNVYGQVPWNWMTEGPSWSFLQYWHVLILPLQKLGKGSPQRPGCQCPEAIPRSRKGRPLPINNTCTTMMGN